MGIEPTTSHLAFGGTLCSPAPRLALKIMEVTNTYVCTFYLYVKLMNLLFQLSFKIEALNTVVVRLLPILGNEFEN